MAPTHGATAGGEALTATCRSTCCFMCTKAQRCNSPEHEKFCAIGVEVEDAGKASRCRNVATDDPECLAGCLDFEGIKNADAM